MCIPAIIFEFESENDYQETKEKNFYNKNDENWDYYSGLPNPKAYEKIH
jgi:hypothetical protein